MDTKLNEKIVKVGSKWQVQSEKGRNMGTYDTKEEAEKRLKQVHYFKHLNESTNEYREKGLQIYYWLEDRGLSVNYSDWGETFYYSFDDEQDYNNAIYLLSAYCGNNAIMDTDSNRLEIRVDIPTAYTKLKKSLNESPDKFGLETDDEIEMAYEQSIQDAESDRDKAYFERDQIKNNYILRINLTDYDGAGYRYIRYVTKDYYKDDVSYYDYLTWTVDEKDLKDIYNLIIFDNFEDAIKFRDDTMYEIFAEDQPEREIMQVYYPIRIKDLYKNESVNSNDDADTITEQLIESDSVEANLDEILRDTLATTRDEFKIGLFEPRDDENNIADFDDSKVDFNTLQIYSYDGNNPNLPVASFMLSGGLNGSGTWTDYLDDLQKVFDRVKEATLLEPLLYEEETDIADDVWYVKVLLYNGKDDDEEEDLNEDVIDETYSKDELDSFKNKVFNQRKIMSIYRKKKYGKNRLMCRTKCVNCGREKKLFLSNLVTNPEKYGSCICSDKNIESRYDTINGLYKGTKKLRNNTSGYTGVSWVSTYAGEPYNKWRAYIDIDGQRSYLGDFSSKSKAIRARKAAAAKGIKWYSENKDQFMATSRRRRKRRRKLKTKRSTANS